jgi:outer membrane biosynthesis protein TonB
LIADRVFLAFDTGQGLAHVQASGWQRTYLLWTFRNFRGVPHKILNTRQRQMVEALYPAASINLGREFDEDTVIGTVEDFVPPFPVPVPVSTAAEKLVSRIPAKKLASVSAPSPRAPLHAHYGRLAFSGLTQTVGTGVVVLIVAVVTWQQLRTRPVVSSSTPEPAVIQQSRAERHADEERAKGIAPAIVPSSIGKSQPLPQVQIANAASTMVAPVPAISSSGPKASQSPAASQHVEQASRREANHKVVRAHVNVTELAGRQHGSMAQPRMKISGPPQKLVYPVCPDSSTRGKVSLQAVVGYDGTVSQVRVLGGNRLLAAAAKRAIREWRYEPFSADAQKLQREARITISFISDDVVAVSFPDAAPVSR